MSAEFTQIELEQTELRIDGYFLPRPGENRPDAFSRAKAELIKHLQRNIECAEAMAYDRWTGR